MTKSKANDITAEFASECHAKLLEAAQKIFGEMVGIKLVSSAAFFNEDAVTFDFMVCPIDREEEVTARVAMEALALEQEHELIGATSETKLH